MSLVDHFCKYFRVMKTRRTSLMNFELLYTFVAFYIVKSLAEIKYFVSLAVNALVNI